MKYGYLYSLAKKKEEQMKKNEYQCACCNGIFEKGIPDEKAWKEFDKNFPGQPHQVTEIICDDCYEKMIAMEPLPIRA